MCDLCVKITSFSREKEHLSTNQYKIFAENQQQSFYRVCKNKLINYNQYDKFFLSLLATGVFRSP